MQEDGFFPIHSLIIFFIPMFSNNSLAMLKPLNLNLMNMRYYKLQKISRKEKIYNSPILSYQLPSFFTLK